MKSVDKLRELGSQYHDRIIFFKEEFDKCLDAIEEEGRTRYGTEYTDELYQFARRVEVAANDRDDVTLFGVDYTALPEDAEGNTIHVGDVMEWDNGTFTVHELKVTEDGWTTWDEQHGYTVHADECRHHHAPTVEDVLREFVDEFNRDDTELSDGEIIERFAAKLRLAGDE